MANTYSAGIVTAYGAAKRGGYTGTYDQFCADLARLADVLEEFLGFSVTIQTLAEGQQATASYENGVLSLGIPKGDTGNGIQSISLLSTVGLVKTYRITYTNGSHFDFPVADGKGIQSTVLNSDYTLTITYTDGTTWTSESIRGQVGATPHLTIGTVETLLPTQKATATITGTDENPVLNLGIPKGDIGEVSQSEFDALSDDVSDLTRHLSDVESAITAELTPVNLTGWEFGSYSSSGELFNVDKRIRNQTKVGVSKGTQSISCDDGYKFLVLAYNASGTCLGFLKTSGSFTVESGDRQWLQEFPCNKYPTYEFKVVLSIDPDSTSITVADGVHCYFNSMTDKTLSIENKAADAKSTGDEIRNVKNAIGLKFAQAVISSNPAIAESVIGALPKNTIIKIITSNANIGFYVINNGTAIKSWSKNDYTTDDDYENIVIKVKKNDSTALTQDDIDGTSFVIKSFDSSDNIIFNDIKNITGCEKINERFINNYRIVTSGDIIDIDSPVYSLAFSYLIVDAYSGDKFSIKGTGGKTSRLWAFVANNGTKLTTAPENHVGDYDLITAPDNSRYLVINTSTEGEVYSGWIVKTYIERAQNEFNANVEGEHIQSTRHPNNPALLRNTVYDVKKGDTIDICSTNSAIGFYVLFSGHTIKAFSKDTFVAIQDYDELVIGGRREDSVSLSDADVAGTYYIVNQLNSRTESIWYGADAYKRITGRKINDFNRDPWGTVGETIIKSNGFADVPFVGAILVNIATKEYSVENIKLIIDSMALKGLEFLELMLTGNKIALKLNNMSIEYEDKYFDLSDNADYDGGGYLSESDMIELINYAKSKNIEIIPQIETPSHMKAFLYDHPEYQYAGSNSQTDYDRRTINLSNPDAVNYALAIIDLYAKWFAKQGIKYFGIATDEYYTSGTPLGYVTLYNNGVYDYANYINTAAVTVAKYRMIPFMWSDAIMIDNNKFPYINRCIFANVWHNGNDWATPGELINGGYKVINSAEYMYYSYGWTDAHNPSISDIEKWNIYKCADNQTYQNISGVKMCFWSGDEENGDKGDTKILQICSLIEAFGDIVDAQKPNN